jgi:hypothetical protein
MHRKVDARTAIAADDPRIRAGHALKLRVVHHKYATQITAHARAVKRASSFGSKPRLRGHRDRWPRLRRAPRCRLRGDAILTLAARFLAQASRMWSIWPAAWPIAPATAHGLMIHANKSVCIGQNYMHIHANTMMYESDTYMSVSNTNMYVSCMYHVCIMDVYFG